MKKLVLILALAGLGIAGSGCVGALKFAQYGFLEDASCKVWNRTPRTITLLLGDSRKIYELPPGATLEIPREYQLFARNEAYIPITAAVTDDYSVRSAGMTWHFSHQGHYLATNGYAFASTRGRYVLATIELSNPRPGAKQNSLQFKVQR